VDQVAAVSCGIYNGTAVLDLDYAEDSAADADANFILTASGELLKFRRRPKKRRSTMPHLLPSALAGRTAKLFAFRQRYRDLN